MKKLLFSLLTLFFLHSCAPKQYQAIILPETDYVDLDTLVVSAPKPKADESTTTEISNTLPKYNPSQKRELDLIHTKLELRFNWETEQVLGKATLTLKPYFYPLNKITLDAKGFVFNKISYEGTDKDLTFNYDGEQVVIELGKTFDRKQEFKLFIDYTATPRGVERNGAITSDKGLFFINADNKDTEKPQQIWTQGETENNSRWFPTIDKPNERCTQEMYLTVQDKFKTLSNGVLVSSKKNNDGTRTDYWKMDIPHAPYLFMIAVGEYAVVRDMWKGKPVEYYVEPKYEKHARAIFPHTPEMLTFFSDKLDFEYPWQKYSQVVVRDFVSGAMENTTASIFGEFVQQTESELLDNLTNEKIVAHELFHHWFGNYVTCESWANLTMNEGFANYSEYLWIEHKHGKDEADFHRFQEMQGYLEAAQSGIHHLIDFSHADKEDMFDAHSYNKGGLILHMLHKYVGDEAFFAALNKYLKDNALTDVEADELRLAFEEVTGEDLNWFFNQWFFNQGHPVLNIDYDYDDEGQEVIVTVEQVQNAGEMPAIFILPVNIDIYTGGTVSRYPVLVNQRKQTFRIPSVVDPDLIVFDGDGALLAEVQEQKSIDEYIYQFQNVPFLAHRIEALSHFSESDDDRVEKIFEDALDDSFWLMRMLAVSVVEANQNNGTRIAKLAEKDPNSNVREAAVMKLSETGDKQYAAAIVEAIENDPAIRVVSSGLEALTNLDEDAVLAVAKKLEKRDEENVILALANVYAKTGDPSKLSFFEEKFDKIEGYSKFNFIENYAALGVKADANGMLKAAQLLHPLAMDATKLFWLRFLATMSINDMHAALSKSISEEKDAAKKSGMQAVDEKLKSFIMEIIAWEKEPQIIELYKKRNYPDPQ